MQDSTTRLRRVGFFERTEFRIPACGPEREAALGLVFGALSSDFYRLRREDVDLSEAFAGYIVARLLKSFAEVRAAS
jgi:hypothetical protein